MKPYLFFHHRMAFLPLALLIALAMMGCPTPNPPRPCAGFTQVQAAYPVTIYSYGANVQINANEYSSVTLRPGDTITLVFECTPELPSTPNPTPGATVAIAGKTAKITMDQSFTGTSIIEFSKPQCIFTINEGNVWPGDANADGRRNLHDLMPICYAIANRITLDSVPPVRLQFPPDPTEMHHLRRIPPSRKTFQIGSRTIDYVHADCNLDGLIDTSDVAYLMAVLTPALPPNCLVDQLQGISLKASMVGTPEPIILAAGSFGLQIPFEIKAALDPGISINSVLGISFTRSLTEMAGIRVVKTEFSYQQGDVFYGPESDRLWRQRFWDEIDMTIADPTCVSHVDKPLDVAMFALKTPGVAVADGNRIGNCNITLLDVMRTANTPVRIPLFQHITGAIAYTYSRTTGLSAHAITCTVDSDSVDLSGICMYDELILRDSDLDNGRMPNANPEQAFISPDIWLRHSQDGLPDHQMVNWANKNELYAKVFNKSCDTMYNVTVHLYYCFANSATQYPADFNGSPHDIGIITFPMVAPMSSAIGSMQWIAPALQTGLPGIPVPTFVGRTSYADVFNGPLVKDVLQQNAVAARSSFTFDASTTSSSQTALIDLRLIPSDSKKSIVVEQVHGPLHDPASNYGSFTLVNAGKTLLPPNNTTNMNATGTSPWPFALKPGATSGAITWDRAVANGLLGIRFTPNNTQPNFSEPVRYRFRVYMVEDPTGSPIIYNSSIFELTIP